MRSQPIYKFLFVEYQRHKPTYKNQSLNETPIMWWRIGDIIRWHRGSWFILDREVGYRVWQILYKPWKNSCSYTEFNKYWKRK